MLTELHDKCFRAMRSLRFNWFQNPVVVLDKKLKTIGLNSDYFTKDLGLFEVFRKRLYRRLNKRYRGLLDFIVPAHFIDQIEIMWYMVRGKPRNEQTYEQMKRAITTPSCRKRFTPRTTVEKSIVTARSKPLKGDDSASNFFRDQRQLEKVNRNDE